MDEGEGFRGSGYVRLVGDCRHLTQIYSVTDWYCMLDSFGDPRIGLGMCRHMVRNLEAQRCDALHHANPFAWLTGLSFR